MVSFRKMNEDEYRRFMEKGVAGYTETLIKGRTLDRELVRREAEEAFYRMFPEGIRKGYAAAALAEMERIAKADGCAASGLCVWDHNPGAYKLYEKCGYASVSHGSGGSYMKKNCDRLEDQNGRKPIAAVMFSGSNRRNGAVAGPLFDFIDQLFESERTWGTDRT